MITGVLCLAVLGGWCVMWWLVLTPSARITFPRRAHPNAKRSFRNRFTFAVGVCGWIFVGVLELVLGGAADTIPFHGIALLAVISSLFAYLCAIVTMFPVVRLTPRHLVVRNPGRNHCIPWSAVREVRWQDGFDVVVDGMPEPLHSAAFQRSLAGQVAGHPSARNAAEEIDAFRAAQAADVLEAEIRVTVPLWAHLKLLAGVVLVYWLILPVGVMMLAAVPTPS
ncbi:hypothetical protein AB0M47_19975 [Hamadaea sp. NPDC051192]|uniref:hypothetical protein n=1 Tax=Hamadaea sp. NPDC051192 TaxID=3154940 RepID=UPI00343BC18A